MRQRLAYVFVLALMSGCKSATAPVSLTGTWTGTISSSALGSGTTTIGLVESSAGVLTGTWTVSYPSQPNASGSLTGSFDGSGITATLTPSVPSQCPYNLTGQLKGSTSITANYAAFNCTVAVSGAIAINKQP